MKEGILLVQRGSLGKRYVKYLGALIGYLE
jgi:hypothetical protein